MEAVVVVLIVAVLAAAGLLWLKLRQVERGLAEGARGLAAIERVVRAECLPAVTEAMQRTAAVVDRLDAERAAAEATVETSRQGLAPLVEDLRQAASRVGEARAELLGVLARASEQRAPATPEPAPDVHALARAHLVGMGIGLIAIDGVAARPDGTHVVRARGMRGDELWAGAVVVRDGKVESAAPHAGRMFP